MENTETPKRQNARMPLHGVRWLIAGAMKRAAVAVGLCGSTLDERQRHLSICLSCERNHGGACDACGCSVRHKVLLAGERCPIDKWSNRPRDSRLCRAVHWLAAKLGGALTGSRCGRAGARLKVIGDWLDARVGACLQCDAHGAGWTCDGEPVAARLRDPAWRCPMGKFERQEGAA